MQKDQTAGVEPGSAEVYSFINIRASCIIIFHIGGNENYYSVLLL